MRSSGRAFALLFTLLSALLLAPSVAMAQQSAEACAAVPADAERLACYDAIFRAGAPATEADGALSILSQQLIPARPTGREPAVLTLACGPNGLSLTLAFANQFLSETSAEAPVTFQRDLGAQQTRNLPTTPDRLRIGFATAAEVAAFLDTLDGVRTLRVRVTPPRQRSLVVDFRLVDEAAQIAALRQGCL